MLQGGVVEDDTPINNVSMIELSLGGAEDMESDAVVSLPHHSGDCGASSMRCDGLGLVVAMTSVSSLY